MPPSNREGLAGMVLAGGRPECEAISERLKHHQRRTKARFWPALAVAYTKTTQYSQRERERERKRVGEKERGSLEFVRHGAPIFAACKPTTGCPSSPHHRTSELSFNMVHDHHHQPQGQALPFRAWCKGSQGLGPKWSLRSLGRE